MQIICVSRGTYEGGKDLAEALAGKLGVPCLSREDITDEATRAGIHVGKLEMAVVRRQPLDEELAVQRELFQAFVSATLCERSQESGFVYHGRTGHLVLLGVSPIFRVRVIADTEVRIAQTMERLGLDREKATRLNEEVDTDIRRWVRVLYNVDPEAPDLYDVVVNLSRVSVENTASALVNMAVLPDFQVTPAARRALDDLSLASRCRLAIGSDRRTRDMQVRVRADGGAVTAIWLPRDRKAAPALPEVLESVPGVERILCTMATTNLLWIEDHPRPDAPALPSILEIAGMWNAAVEILRPVGEGDVPDEEREETVEKDEGGERAATATSEEDAENGGILDDRTEEPPEQDEGVRETMGRLISAGRAGSCRTVGGGAGDIVRAIDRTVPYSLVVVGDVFSNKSELVRKRLARDLESSLADALRVPVIGADELKSQYLFGPAQVVRMVLYLAAAAAIFVPVFLFQEPILGFLVREGTGHRLLAAACLFLVVPTFAWLYGNLQRYLFRLMKIH